MTTPPCASAPALFFGHDGERATDRRHRESQAKLLCRTCPAAMREACLRVAMDAEGVLHANARHGVFGGLGPTDRARRAKAEHGGLRPGPAPSAMHGTVAAYKRHLRHKETPCPQCAEAMRAYRRALPKGGAS